MPVHPAQVTPTTITKKGNRQLELTWEDGHVSLYTFRQLRQKCPCAGCIDEWTNKKTLAEEKVPLDIEGLKVEPVGGYALSFTFTDQHNTGIYHFSYLREICPCCSSEKNDEVKHRDK